MGHILSLTDGVTTFSLVTGNCMLTRYVPETAPEGDESPVSETVELVLFAATTVLLQVAENQLRLLLRVAAERLATGVGKRLYLQLQLANEASSWRSEVLGANLQLGSEALTAWGNAQMTVTLHLRRVGFWEGAEVELPLASKAQTGAATGGRTIHNCNDSTRGNYVQVASTAVAGATPAPVRVQLTNISGAGQDYRNLYLATNAYSDPANLVYTLQGEARQAGYGTVASSSFAANGQHLAVAVNLSYQVNWDLSAAQMQAAAGRYFRVFMRVTAAPSAAVYVAAEVREEFGLVTLARTPSETKISPSSPELIDLGALPLPPGGGNGSGWGVAVLTLTMRAATATTLYVDYLQLMPTESLRHLVQRGMTVPSGDAVVDDGIAGEAYELESGVRQSILIQRGQPVRVWPGVTQRVYISFDVAGGSAPVDTQTSVRMWYRPRRRAV